MLDQISVLKLVSERLAAADIPYMITGSIAAGYYSRPRMTRDIDIVVALQVEDTERFAEAMGSEFMPESEDIRSAITRRSMFNLIHQAAIVKVDFIVRKNDVYRAEEFKRRRLVRIADCDVWMVTPEDLILSKLLWAKDSQSELQLRDVQSVLRIQGDVLDWDYIERWAKELTVAAMLREVR